MAQERELILKLGKKLTDRADVKLGLTKLDANSPEYYGLNVMVTDEMAELALKMDIRKPYTPAELAKKAHKPEAYVEDVLEKMAKIGLVEYNWENEDHHKQYDLPCFIPGSAEFMTMHTEVSDEHTEIGKFFKTMGRLPLEKVTKMVPPGGAGIGMHVVPVEKAIPSDQMSVDLEHLSHWLDKYKGQQFAVGICSCRRMERQQNNGCGELEDECCIGVGDLATYLIETGLGRSATLEEVKDILQRCEDNGYVHQITNIDGPDKIIGICNCCLGSCVALRTSQLFNTPNMSASSFRAHVTKENCVACGKCVEVCPSGAAKLGQKLCSSKGPIEYPVQPLPDDLPWDEGNWNPNYIQDNMENCHKTGTAPCKTACPAHIAVQGYIRMAAEGRYMDALKLIKLDNPFPAVCGSICNRPCESACTRGLVDEPLAIDEIKKFIAEQELNADTRYIPKRKLRKGTTDPYPEKIAIIGAGPAGMTCAYWLANMGYDNVTVFEKNPTPGGMLTMGIPSFRLNKEVVNAEIDVLRQMGVQFQCGTEVGKDITLGELRKQGYKAFYIAIGAQKSAPLHVPGENLHGVYGGVEFLRKVNQGTKPRIGKKCAVIGGGNVAMDVCRTAARLGAETTVIYRRSEEEMPADREELEEAKAEGIRFAFLRAPAEIIGEKDRVKAIKVEIMELGEPDSKGCRKPIGTGKFETIEVDSVIGAIGQKVDWGKLDTGKMTRTQKDLAAADGITYQTGEPDIFVGGDVFSGPKFAINAIAAGREGAESIHRYVHWGQSLTLARNLRNFTEMDKENALVPLGFDNAHRQKVRHDTAKAKTFENDRVTFTEEQVKKEAARCLGCGACVVDQNKCIGCGLCTTRCEFDAIHLRRDHPEATRMVRTEDKFKEILPYAAKRAMKIKIRQMREKHSGK